MCVNLFFNRTLLIQAAAGDFLGHGESSADPVDESQSVLEEYLREVGVLAPTHFPLLGSCALSMN